MTVNVTLTLHEQQRSSNVHGSVHRNDIPICVQQYATLHSLFYLETALHVSGGTITHHQERKQLYLHHLVFVTPLLLSAAIVGELELVWVYCGWRTLSMFISFLGMFRATICSSSGEKTVSMRHLVFLTLCGWPVIHTEWQIPGVA
jgi:hypothetical protein